MRRELLASAASCVAFSGLVSAQSLPNRINALHDGAVNFHFAARPGICGDGARYIQIGHATFGQFGKGMERARCDVGPVQVRVMLHDGKVDRIESWAGTLRTREGSDLGLVSARDASRYLLDIARRADGSASTKAILPAVLADSSTTWPDLLAIARDVGTRSHSTRQDAAFWLSRFASAAVSGHRNDLEDDDDSSDDDVKGHAVFVLSQLPNQEGIGPLLEVARTNKDAHVRSKAMFWLGQSGDVRALDLFESVLRS